MRKKEFDMEKTSRRRLGVVLSTLAMTAVILAGAAAGFIIFTLATGPDLSLMDAAPDGYRTTVVDSEGETMLTLAGAESNRVYVKLDVIPEDLRAAVVAIEDERFYDHRGIDLQGIARAVVINVRNGSLSQGASTITQQLVKNNIFTHSWMEEETVLDKVQRKLREQYLALQLEQKVDKDWILENYLNTINLGGGTWGVQTAALRYFGKDVSQLTLSECAVLAGITKNPSGFNPVTHPEASRRRQELVLNKMLELGYIDETRHAEALADDVFSRVSGTGGATEIFSYFEDAMIRQVRDDLIQRLGCTEEEAWDLIYRGGLTIHTTQDTALQQLCEAEINDSNWYSSPETQATVVLMDPYTGQVRAIVGGRGEKEGSLTWNRATSGIRQPGSTIKVVAEYADLLDSGEATLATVYDDAPYTYSNGTSIRNANGTYAGRTTIRQAIADSTNIVALRCFQQAGLDDVWQRLEMFGFANLTGRDRVEALALGGTSGGVTNLEMTAAYSAIANGGEYISPTFYTQVLDREGEVLLQAEQQRRSAVSAQTAALLTDAMEDVITDGTGGQAYFSGMPLAGKSGTTSQMRDVWFVGYSPYYACGVWGGYDDYSVQKSSAYVKKIWRAVMQEAHEGLDYRDFAGDGLVDCTVCAKCGVLAVEGLCDNTVQGNMSYVESFVPGSEPVENCTCHVKVELCTATGQLAGAFCPRETVDTKVYLKEGLENTADAFAVCPTDLPPGSCPIHNWWWQWSNPFDSFRGGSTTVAPQPEEPKNPIRDAVDSGSLTSPGAWRDFLTGLWQGRD